MNGENTQVRQIKTKAPYLLVEKPNSRKCEVGRYTYIAFYLISLYIFQIH